MDKKLELRLIEGGYKPGKSITLKQAAGELNEIIFKSIESQTNPFFWDGNHYDVENNLVLFNGTPNVHVSTGHTSKLESHAIAFSAGQKMHNCDSPSIQIYSLEDLMKGSIGNGGFTYIPIKEDYDIDVEEKSKLTSPAISIQITSHKSWGRKNQHGYVLIFPGKEQGIFLFERDSKVDQDNNFWKYIMTEMGLNWTYEPTTHGFNAEQNGVRLNARYSTITVEFSRKVQKKFLSELVEGIDVGLSAIDGISYTKGALPYIPVGGKKFQVSLNHGHKGETAIAYLSRVLEKTKVDSK